jgi:hypothetical protein
MRVRHEHQHLPTVAAAAAAAAVILTLASAEVASAWTYPVVGTGQTQCYSDSGPIACPLPGQPFYGQDAQHRSPQPAYRDNGDGTVSDLNTQLIWVSKRGNKVTYEEARAGAAACRAGGHRDWRLPTIKELYSLINFNGSFHPEGNSIPYLDTRYFEFRYGDPGQGERPIDCQDWSATEYLGTTMRGNATVFGVNFADGRIKGYPKFQGPDGNPKQLYVRYVRGNSLYGKNDLKDNRDGTITDGATGLIWSRQDSGTGMDWQAALAWVQEKNNKRFLGHNDWRLPNAKELQSIVDYTRCPQATDASRRSAAISPLFAVSTLRDGDYPFFWSSTTHLDGPYDRLGRAAIYIAFGSATGWMRFPGQPYPMLVDVHGAGAQRSDPKSGNPDDYPYGRGPQGDVVRIYNNVRLVRDSGHSSEHAQE